MATARLSVTSPYIYTLYTSPKGRQALQTYIHVHTHMLYIPSNTAACTVSTESLHWNKVRAKSLDLALQQMTSDPLVIATQEAGSEHNTSPHPQTGRCKKKEGEKLSFSQSVLPTPPSTEGTTWPQGQSRHGERGPAATAQCF